MATALKSKPGLTGATALSIPATWDATWFRHFIHNMLKGADVRNAVGAGGVTVTGNISSPYATIGFNGSTGLVITDGTHTVNGVTSIQFSGAVVSGVSPNGVVTISASGGVTSVTGTAAQITATPTTGAVVLSFPTALNLGTGTAFLAGQVEAYTTGTTPLGIGTTGAAALHLYADSTLAMTIGSAGNVSIAAPSSGNALVINSAGSASAIVLNLSSGTGGIVQEATGVPTLIMNSPGADFGQIGSNGTQTWFLGYGGSPTANGTAALTWNATGNVVIPTPSSGIGLTVSGIPGNWTSQINGNASSGNSYGLLVESGTNSSDYCAAFYNQAASAPLLGIHGDGGVTVGAPTGGSEGTGTVNATGYYLNGVAISTGKVISVSFTGLAAGGAITGSVNAGSPSYVRNAAGDYTITWAPGFTPVAASVTSGAVSNVVFKVVTLSSTTLRVQVANSSTAALQDTGAIYVIAQ